MTKTKPTIASLLFRKTWHDERAALHAILTDCGLEPTVKWNKLTYTAHGGNIAIIQAMKGFVAVAFFKGALLDDPDGLLRQQGEHSQSMMRVEFPDADCIATQEKSLRKLVESACRAEKEGRDVDKSGRPEIDPPQELLAKFKADDTFRKAFEALSPGRQRGYLIHFTGARQSATRTRRIEKYEAAIRAGEGMHDR